MGHFLFSYRSDPGLVEMNAWAACGLWAVACPSLL